MRPLILFLFSFSLAARAASFLVPSNPPPVITLAWDTITDPTITNVNLYYGVSSRGYTNIVACGLTNQFTVTLPARGVTFYFAATSVASSGLESSFSGEASYLPANPPNAPNMHPPVILHVQSAPAPTSIFSDAGMDWGLSPQQARQFYKLRIENSPQLAVMQLKPPAK